MTSWDICSRGNPRFILIDGNFFNFNLRRINARFD
ncbi:hypothetical protein EVA_07570 [gut metagenome]|uniref:Uncharacterized protein n=1 Tax=gut metagenome TaxID=749906 RepID=J9GBU7_9ZZZZ